MSSDHKAKTNNHKNVKNVNHNKEKKKEEKNEKNGGDKDIVNEFEKITIDVSTNIDTYDTKTIKNSGDILIEKLLNSIRRKPKINAIAYVDDPSCDFHKLIDEGHQESHIRTGAIRKAVQELNLDRFMERTGSISVRKADLNVHSLDYINTIFEHGQKNKPVRLPSPSTEASMTDIGSLESILAAAASVMGGVDVVCGKYEIKKNKKNYKDTRVRKVFCNVRPPGHHAHHDHGAGFCFMNNVAIGANFAMTKYGNLIKKVLIFDWDLHHGDGTQNIFKDNQNVMCVSFHRGGYGLNKFYPGTGLERSNEAGNIINFPISFGETADSYMKKFNEEFLPMARTFDPDLVIISAGFDSHKDDLYHESPLDYVHFADMTKALAKLADEHASGRLVSVLEGGYTPDVLYKCSAVHIATLIDGYDDESGNNEKSKSSSNNPDAKPTK